MPVSAAKEQYAEKFNRYLDTYSKVLFVTLDNVTSMQIHNIRRDLRGKGELLMGKNTMQRRIVMNRAKASESDIDKTLVEKFVEEKLLTGNRGLLFTNSSPEVIEEIFIRYRNQAPARVGAIAPCDVIVPAGNTGLEPTQTSFFQALGVTTKITKGTVEIVSDKKVLNSGEKVDNSVAALLAKLKISPFWYMMDIICMWDSGIVFSKDDLKVTDDSLKSALLGGISNISALSVGAGVPTSTSVPLALLDAFTNLLAVSVETEYVFDDFGAKQLRDDVKSGKLAAAAVAHAPAAPAAAAAKDKAAAPAKKEEKKPEPEPEEDDDMGFGGLF